MRLLIRSDDPADLQEAHRRLMADWAATVERIRATPGIEHRSANDEWSAVQTLRHLVFVHDSWFRRCVLGSTAPFTPMGLAIDFVPDQEEQGLDPRRRPESRRGARGAGRAGRRARGVAGGGDARAAGADGAGARRRRLAAVRPRPSVRQCLGTVLNEIFEHHGFCVRDLDRSWQRAAE